MKKLETSAATIILFFGALLLIGLLPEPVWAQIEDADRVVLQLKWYHQFQFAGYYAAAEKGFYRDVGLEVEIREGGTGIVPALEVGEERADFGIENSEVLLHRIRGNPLVALAAILQHSPLVLLTPADSPYRSPHDLMGTRVMMGEGVVDIEIAAMLQREGVQLESVEKLGYTLSPEVFLDPDIAAIAAYSTNTPFILEERDIDYRTIAPIEYGIDFYSDVLFTCESMMRKNPEMVSRFREASLRGWEYAMENPEEVADIIIRTYGTEKSRRHLLFESEAMRDLMLPDLIEIGHMNPGRWERIGRIFQDLGMVEAGYSLHGFLLEEYETLTGDRLRTVGIISLVVVVLSLLTALVMMLYNRGLRKAVDERTGELKKLNSELEEKERDLSQAQRLAHIGNWILDSPFTTVRASDEGIRIFGFTKNVLPLDDVIVTLESGYRELARSMLRDAVAEGKPVELECKILTSGGVDRNVLIKGAVQTDETGAVVRLYGTVQDITEKKMAEEQLRIQRDLAVEVAGAETLEESAAMSVFGALEITSTDCGALFLRRNERENLQVLFREGFPDSIIDLLIDRGRIYLEPRNTESRASFEIPEDIRGPLKFITVFPLRYHTIPFGFLAVGSVDKVRIQEVGARAMESLAAQISNGLRQKLSEYARRLSEQRYRGLFKSMMNGVTRTDEEGRYKEANEAFLRMVGYSEEELRKLTYRDITPEDWVEGEREILAEQVTRNGYTEEYEKEYIRKDGSRVPVSVRIWSTRRPDTGEDEYWAVVRDITERKESERLIERAMNDLKRSNEELKDFAYIASHDLQEPLRSITGFSELLSRRYGDRLDEDGTRFLELVMSAARRMQRLIEDLLSYSRLNTRAKPFEQIDTEEVVETVKLNLVIIIQEKNAEIIVHPLPPVQGDPAQITQLFQNLIGNAIKYGREGVPPRIEISCTDKGGVWHFSVADNGIGIEEEHLEVIFKMFQRLHGREEYSGTGIGLALCKRIVERHGGVLWAESTYGEGTIFHFTLSKQP